MSYLREYPGANMQDFLYGTNSETPSLFVEVGRSILRSESQLTHMEREMMAAFCLSLNNALQPINAAISIITALQAHKGAMNGGLFAIR